MGAECQVITIALKKFIMNCQGYWVKLVDVLKFFSFFLNLPLNPARDAGESADTDVT